MFAQSNIASQNSSRPLTNDTEHETQSLPTPAPLCKVYYHAFYNELQPTKTHCVTCGSDLRKTTVCVCPDPQTIQKYLAEKTDFQGKIKIGAKVCHPCYKSHLNILKVGEKQSTDISLLAVIQTARTCCTY